MNEKESPSDYRGQPGWAIVTVGAVSGALAVAAGAFGAHILETVVTPDRLGTFRTGASYHLAHALATVLTGLAAVWRPLASSLRWAGWLFVLGTTLFSGSLYALVLLRLPILGLVTPFGGIMLIAGWAVLAWGAAQPAMRQWRRKEGAERRLKRLPPRTQS